MARHGTAKACSVPLNLWAASCEIDAISHDWPWEISLGPRKIPRMARTVNNGRGTFMQRLIEQPVGDGEVFEEKGRVGRVHYHLAVYQHFSEAGEPVPAHFEVEGRVSAHDALDLARLHHLGLELTLRLADGRALDFRIVHEDGTIHSTARGLYMPE